ncbi:MAG: hypothetical protein J0H69_23015 [Burkholderiales bacterium]|nr:hypothetical protein [Burkholderiales bacterium]
MTTLTPAHQALDAVEQQLEAVTDALRRGDAMALQGATERLRAVALASSRALQGVAEAGLRERLLAAQRRMVLQREQISRGSAMAERAVRTVLPHTVADTPTYGPAMGASRGAGAAARLYAGRG